MKIIMGILILSLILITACVKEEVVNPKDILDDPQQECERIDGKWSEFRTACVDSCDLERASKGIVCATVITKGCDCGAYKCWNGNTCEMN